MELDVTLDAEADAAYVSLGPIEDGEIVETVVIDRPPGRRRLRRWRRARGMVVLDFDREGRLRGVEVIGAEGLLPAGLRAGARRIDLD